MDKLKLDKLKSLVKEEMKKKRDNEPGDLITEVRSILAGFNTKFKTELREIKIPEDRLDFEKNEQKKYASKAFKAFIINCEPEGRAAYNGLLDNCEIDAKNTIPNFIQEGKNTGLPQLKTQDFFAVYCGFEGFKEYEKGRKSVVIHHKPIVVAEIPQTQNEHILGTIIINHNFIAALQNENFSLASFYSAKDDKRCQWYGITQNWDIKREVYDEVQKIIETSFDENKIAKISAIVHGDGGSGKSTLLRRLAVDNSGNKNFRVIWLEKFQEFWSANLQNGFTLGWETIKNNPNQRYLIFIEDWHNRVGLEVSKKFLNETKDIQNIRLIIGDRHPHGKDYELHLIDDKKFQLNVSENKQILQQIVQKVPEWESAIETLLSDNVERTSSLFMLLFIIAQVSKNKALLKLNLSDPQNAFKEIIRYDLERLSEQYNCSGLAKALHYLSCIYSECRVLVSYESLLLIAAKFNTTGDKDPQEYKDLTLEGEVTRILKTYIGIRVEDSKDQHHVFYFHHDILSDIGLSAAYFSDWLGYTPYLLKEVILKEMLANGDDASASVLLNRLVLNKPVLFKGKEEILGYINQLFEKWNLHGDYIDLLVMPEVFSLTLEELDSYAERLWKIKHFGSSRFWSEILKYLKWREKIFFDENLLSLPSDMLKLSIYSVRPGLENSLIQSACEKIMKCRDLYHINSDFIYFVLSFGLNINKVALGHKICRKILSYDDLSKFDTSVICKVLEISTDISKGKLVIEACKKILPKTNFYKFNSSVICKALSLSVKLNNEEFVQKICKNILMYPDLLELHPKVIYKCLFLYIDIHKETFIQEVYRKILAREDWLEVESTLICTVLKLCPDKEEGGLVQNACRKILNSDNLLEIPTPIVSTALSLYIETDENELVQNACRKILNKYNRSYEYYFSHMPYDIMSAALYRLKDPHFTKSYAKFVLFSAEFEYYESPVYLSLHFFAAQVTIPSFVTNIITRLINDYQSDLTYKITGQVKTNNDLIYFTLLKIPFHSIPLWKSQTTAIISNWQNLHRSNIYHVILAYRKTHAHEIQPVCKEILINGVEEVSWVFNKSDQPSPFAKHLVISLGHPKLKTLALSTAKKINLLLQSGLSIPDYAQKAVEDIVSNNIFPRWDAEESLDDILHPNREGCYLEPLQA
jgi:hypothetical protein